MSQPRGNAAQGYWFVLLLWHAVLLRSWIDEHFRGQCMGSLPAQHREEFGLLLNCSGNRGFRMPTAAGGLHMFTTRYP